MHKKFGEVGPCGFRVMRADRQTDTLKHTYTQHNYSYPSGGGEVAIYDAEKVY